MTLTPAARFGGIKEQRSPQQPTSMHLSRIARATRGAVVVAIPCFFAACRNDSPAEPGTSSSGPIEITASSNDVFVGDVFTVRATVRDANGREIPGAPVSFASSDTSVALVSAGGQVVTLRTGTAHISARSGDLTGELALPVHRLTVSTVTVLGLADTLGMGDVVLFGVHVQGQGGRDVPGRQVKLTSSNTAVGIIDPSGRLRAIAPGKTTVTATVDGVAGASVVVVSAEPAELHLRRSDGRPVPVLVEGDSGVVNGGVEYREIYLESGVLRLSGGAQPTYQTTLHYAWYAVTFDANGQRHLTFKSALDIDDGGTVRYDSRGDLVMTSQELSDISHAGSADAGGFTVRYRFVANDIVAPSSFFFRREPK